jgi:hypothetical protein
LDNEILAALKSTALKLDNGVASDTTGVGRAGTGASSAAAGLSPIAAARNAHAANESIDVRNFAVTIFASLYVEIVFNDG